MVFNDDEGIPRGRHITLLDKLPAHDPGKGGADLAALQIHEHGLTLRGVAGPVGKTSETVTDDAIRFLDEADDGPFFLFAHYFDPHYDYVPPGKYDKLFDPDYQGKMTGHNFFKNPEIGERTRDPRLTLRTQKCSQRDLDHIRNQLLDCFTPLNPSESVAEKLLI